MSPLNAVMSHLVADLVTDSLTEYSYDAELGGLRYAISEDDEGLQIIVSGYNDKIDVLLRKVLETLRGFKVDPSRLAVMREQLTLEYQNFRLSQAYRIATYWSRYILQEKAWTKEELLREVPSKGSTLWYYCTSLNPTIQMSLRTTWRATPRVSYLVVT
jgi:insulysin